MEIFQQNICSILKDNIDEFDLRFGNDITVVGTNEEGLIIQSVPSKNKYVIIVKEL